MLYRYVSFGPVQAGTLTGLDAALGANVLNGVNPALGGGYRLRVVDKPSGVVHDREASPGETGTHRRAA